MSCLHSRNTIGHPRLLLLAAACGWTAVNGAVTPPLRAYPRQYGVHELRQGQTIEIDGNLSEPAWTEAPWSESFVDIADGPPPRFLTRFKARWSGESLYIGYYVQDTQIWANQTKDDSVVFVDNDAELFIDPDGSNAWYKELEVNARNTFWALVLDRPYIDGGSAKFGPGKWMVPGLRSATRVFGCTLNEPASGPCSHWTLELLIPTGKYVTNDTVARSPPRPGDLWRWDFSRVEWRVRTVEGRYVKEKGMAADNWVWSSQGAVNMHLPERWGYLCWLDGDINGSSCRQDGTWNIRQALAAVYYAEHQFSAVNGYFTPDVKQLGLPEAVLDGSLGTTKPLLQVDQLSPYSFNATVEARLGGLPVKGTVNTQRLMTFDPPGASVCGPSGCR